MRFPQSKSISVLCCPEMFFQLVWSSVELLFSSSCSVEQALLMSFYAVFSHSFRHLSRQPPRKSSSVFSCVCRGPMSGRTSTLVLCYLPVHTLNMPPGLARKDRWQICCTFHKPFTPSFLSRVADVSCRSLAPAALSPLTPPPLNFSTESGKRILSSCGPGVLGGETKTI